ncbi:protein FAR1-RELATED SEQUENCE 5-like [Neltuma alba]|uniref:protein FAR1-RELATED SEQUENCE 5-like n=1 Tax=Neltuma alba TaxID=207710 RepID=UPI0010A362DE|nr:protein FAR1-RELATED SEQUENCE 5-like [Prosopis alba]
MEADLALRLGKEFDNLEEAWSFWNEYACRAGFSARKNGLTKSKKDKKTIIGYRYACSKEGKRKPDKRYTSATNHRPETRTDCKAGMTVKLVEGKFKIISFIEEHNHPLHLQETVHMMRSQRKISSAQADEIDLAKDAGLKQKETYDLMSKQAGGRANLGFTRVDMKNYLKTKRQRSLVDGEVRCLLNYFEEQITENPSFYHSYQLDVEDKITNIFWADARMLIDYAYFGDVISLDTTYCTNNNHRPFAIFSGLNQYRGVLIFGAALLYDETTESFKWLFETFLKANKQKRPATIFTDQDQAMARALREVIPEVKHALCTWHIEQNGIKHLRNKMKGNSHILRDFNKCMFAIDDQSQFEETWASLISSYNLEDNTWVKSIYEIKEKWAWCYMKHSLTLGMRSTQISESINADIKNITNPSVDINEFFKSFERVVADKRYNEMKCEFEAREKKPRLIVQSSPILRQVAEIYTASMLELFQEQFDLFFATCISSRDERSLLFTYTGTMVNEDKKWTLTFDPKDDSVWPP